MRVSATAGSFAAQTAEAVRREDAEARQRAAIDRCRERGITHVNGVKIRSMSVGEHSIAKMQSACDRHDGVPHALEPEPESDAFDRMSRKQLEAQARRLEIPTRDSLSDDVLIARLRRKTALLETEKRLEMQPA